RDEQGAEWGASHFLEHLLFKGTDQRSAREIAEAIESVGGEMNAFTAHEQTVFYVRVPDVQLEAAFDVLADVLWNPAFRVDDVESRFPSAKGYHQPLPRPAAVAAQPVLVLSRDTEQAHVVSGVRALAALDPDRYALTVVNQVLGGGMSSRLFQEIRETRGLAYSVFSYQASFDDAGFVAIYAGTAPERVPETLSVIDAELDRLVKEGLSDDEISAAKGHLVGSL